MEQSLGLVLLVFSFVCAVCAALGWPAIPNRSIGWAAFAFFIAYLLFGRGTLMMR